MTTLHHIVEPTRLLMTWQPLDRNAPSRTRRVIGEVCQESDGQIVFRYLKNTPDFSQAGHYTGSPELIRQNPVKSVVSFVVTFSPPESYRITVIEESLADLSCSSAVAENSPALHSNLQSKNIFQS